MKTRIFQPLIQLLTILIIASTTVQGKNISKYDCWSNYKFVTDIPEGATDHFIIISSRNLNPENGYECLPGVHPDLEQFIFLVGIVGDSTYITRGRDLEEVIRRLDEMGDFLIYVNGHGKTFEENVGRGVEISERYGSNLIMFDWPTNYLFIRNSLINSRKVTENFASVLKEFCKVKNQYFPLSTSSIVFHSMGNHLAKNLVEMGFSDEVESRMFENLILNAAAVNQKGHTTWVEQLNIQKRLYITYNKGDMALRTVRHLRLKKQLGTGFKSITAYNAVYISFNNVAAMEHNFFLGRNKTEKSNPGFYTLYSTLFKGFEVDLEDSNLLSGLSEGNVFNLQ